MLQLAVESRKSIFSPALLAVSPIQLGSFLPASYYGPLDDEAESPDSFPSFDSAVYEVEEPHRPRRFVGLEHETQLARCGQWLSRFDSATGALKRYQYRCKLKDCPSCGADHGMDLRFKLERAIRNGDGSVCAEFIEISTAKSKRLLRKLPKDKEYLRFPLANDRVRLYLVSNTLHAGWTLQTAEDLANTDWTALQNTPGERNISGSILRLTSVSAEDEAAAKVSTVIVHTENFQIPEEHAEAAHQSELLAIKDTIELLPTGATLQMDINARQRAFKKHLQEANVPFTSFISQKRVKLCYIDWTVGIMQNIDELTRYGLLRKDQLDTILANCTPAQVFEALNSSAVRHLLET